MGKNKLIDSVILYLLREISNQKREWAVDTWCLYYFLNLSNYTISGGIKENYLMKINKIIILKQSKTNTNTY